MGKRRVCSLEARGAFLLFFLAAVNGVAGQLSIRRLDPTYGTTAGGTRLTIYGSGFGDYYTSTPVVFVGTFQCNVIGHLSSSEVITCETSPGLPGAYSVTVVVDSNQDPVSAWGFSYRNDYTPTLKAIVPRAGPPGTLAYVVGDTTWSLRNSDCVEAKWGELSCVGSITFGDYLCRQDPSNDTTGISFTDYSSYPRYGWPLYKVGCLMPAPDGTNTQPAIGTAGSVNATIRFEASLRGGSPTVLRDSYKYDVDGTPYHFQLYPEVTDISPNVGSVAGGTLIKVTGRGFPTLSLGLDDKINVSISGVPCTVVNSTYDTVFCVTGPKPAVQPVEATPIRGLYPGMRGVEYEMYNMGWNTFNWYTALWRLNTTVKLDSYAGSYKTVVTDAWEGPDYTTPYYCSRMKAFFVAPRPGPYRFYMQTDDLGQLNGTWLQDGVEVSRMLVNMTGWTYVDSYFQYAFQSSVPIFLNAGQRILLEGAHCNGVSIGTQQVAVRMPVPEPRLNSMAEVQRITVTSTLAPRQLLVKYLYGAGANTTAFFVNVTSLDDSKLDDPRVGLQLLLNDGSISVVLPLTATSAAMDDMVEAALGGQFAKAANNDLFGIRKTRTQGVLSLQLGINAVLGDAMGFDINMARLVMISNSTNATTNANCIVAKPGRRPPPPAPPPPPPPDVPAGMMVAVATANAVPAVVPDGEFYLGLPSSDEPLVLPYNANATEMANAIYTLTSLGVSVSISTTWREGAYFARVWTVTFPTWSLNNVPNLVAAPSETTPRGVLLATEVRPANPPLTGSFKLAYGSFCNSVTIGLTDSAATIQQKLGTLPGMATPQKVVTAGSSTGGYSFDITFDLFGNPGDQPPLRITDTSGLGGVNPVATVTTTTDGSTDAFYAPIPTEFLQLAVSSPGTISLTVNGAPSACAHPSGLCTFDYSTAATPTITGVSPSRLSFNDETSLPLTITGTMFGSGAVNVTVGTSVCNVTSVSDTVIVCSIYDSAPAGIRLVNVNVAGLGDAVGATNITLETLYVTGTAPAPAVVPSAGLSIFNVTGKGFDRVDCSNNRIFVDKFQCGILACGKNFATVLYPGGGSDIQAAIITAQVFERGSVIDEDSPSSPTVRVSGAAPTIMGVTSPGTMPASGGIVTVSLAAAAPSDVSAMFVVPEIASPNNFSAASTAYKGRMRCANVAPAVGGTGVSCKAPAVQNGKYHVLVVLSSGLQLLSSDTITFDIVITSVTPNAGSIGGGTVLTITGYGFSPVAVENAVFITVPVSSNFLNGMIQCKTRDVTDSVLTCVTQPHLATNADADDPFARKVMPVATTAAPVMVALCDQSNNSTLLLEYCTAMPKTPRARVATSGNASVNFSYSTVLTPSVDGIAPAAGAVGTPIFMSGTYMADVTTAQFLQGAAVRGSTRDVTAGDTWVNVTAPDLPSGVYTILLRKANGEMSVDPYGDGVFTYTPVILGLSNSAGSLLGGRPLTITVGGAGLAVDSPSAPSTAANVTAAGGNSTAASVTSSSSSALSLNTVTIGGLPCPIASVANRTSLTCIPSGMNGYVYAEYWNLGAYTYSIPDLISYVNPVIARLEKGISFDWGTSSPLPGAIQVDFFAARFTFYLQTAQNTTVSFYLASDDDSRLYVDGVLLGGRFTNLYTVLEPGIHKIVVTYVEFGGLASIRLLVSYLQDNGYMSNLAAPEWQKVTPLPPGVQLPVVLTVNGVVADTACAAARVQLQLPYQPPVTFEPPAVNIADGTCAYVYTTQLTPTLLSLKPQALSGVSTPSFAAQNASVSLYGNFLVDPTIPAISQLNVTIANQTCAITDVSSFNYNATLNTTRLTCVLPSLPAGTWPVNVQVAGLGLTRPPTSVGSDLPTVAYALRILAYTSPPSIPGSTQCQFSMFGGGTLTMSGYGLVKNVTDNTTGRSFTPVWEQASMCPVGGSTSPPCMAAQASLGLVTYIANMTLVPLWSDGQSAAVRLTRFRVPNPETYAGITSVRASVRYRPRVTYLYPNNPQYEQQSYADQLYFCGGRTPVLSNISPSTIAPDAGASGSATLSLTWFMSAVGSNNDTLRATAAGSASNATVEFEVGNTTFPCANATVTASKLMATNYTESLRCTLPTYLPAAAYTLWLCVQPFGCGLLPTYTVPLTVASASPLVGSSAGGVVVTLTGNGFDTNVSRVAVRFGNSTCNVTSSTGSTLTCVTGGLDTKPAGPVSAPLSVTPTVGANEATYANFMFTLDPSLESTISAITPNRGSTEGGTPITVTGANFMTGIQTNVTIGGTQCSSVVVISDTTIKCTTGKPPRSILRTPLPVVVYQEGRGNGRGNVSYQYIDLWSRNSTWGGGPLPGFEDSVVIPEGITVLLDISPPKLFLILLQGNLIFDETQPYINLQAHYILVLGGNFTIGTANKPYPGRANITMHGPPNSRDLPMYGAKSLAVRQGVVTFFGQPKVPHYTTLNQTVDPGATSITVNGLVNWQVGDRIVIASSSFYANEVHEATITAIDTASTPGCSVLSLDAPTRYVHLGEIHTQPGGAVPLDMRAEVGVLTRNILLTGDYNSAKTMYGVQVMVNSPKTMPRALIRFDNIEVAQSGQAFRLGRYSIHWHMHGDVAYQSWVRGCSIHHTYNRATTIHGTHRVLYQNNLAYNVMGHTFFLEDGIESGNIIEGNIGIYTKTSDALLNTDTTPATFWITNPNNTVRHNRAAGSLGGYGFWYRLLDNPEGPSSTTTVCPKFTPLVEFYNNTAHSNMFYGLRIHPEYYPRNNPCNGFNSPFAQQPAVFNGLVAYKNGMKGAVGTQLGLVQWTNFVLGDNGGGPKQHVVNGKDNGGDAEMSWVVDDRNRYDVALTQMAGLVNATIYARTTTGSRGSAGAWPSGRRVTGIITQSPVLGDSKHSALMSLINITFVDFGRSTGFTALEACGKCKTFQGGATTFTANISFVNADGGKPGLSTWAWGHQGVYLDTDGTLLNARTLPDSLLPSPSANWTFGPGTTWHSAVESELFDPAECVYVRGTVTSNNGAYCSSALTFRRVMLNNHGPDALMYNNLLLVSLLTNRTSVVHFTNYNEMGYQFTVPTGRDYWVHWEKMYRLDPQYYMLHKMDLMDGNNFVYLSTKHVQVKDHFKVNGVFTNTSSLPPALPTTPHGANFYNKNLTANSWYWGNYTYNDTKFTMFMAGRYDYSLYVAAYACPDAGCFDALPPEEVVNVTTGTYYWSNDTTWASRPGGKPVAGDNVTIPYGWDLIIDENPPALSRLFIQGAARFDPTKDINLTATYIVVTGRGSLRAGSPVMPHPTSVNIMLSGARDTPDLAIDNSLNLGSKVLAAIRGGTIDLFGREVGQRWIRLNAPAKVGDDSITVSDPNHRWRVGDKILITSTTYNVWQSEMRRITAIRSNGSVLALDSPLAHPHGATLKAYPGGPTVDMRAEVALISSNILITTDNVARSYGGGSEYFGARVVVSGNSTGRFSNMAMEYCGQAGFTDRACILFDRLASVTPAANVAGNDTTTSVPLAKIRNPSMMKRNVLLRGLNSNFRLSGSDPINVIENVMYESFDNHGIEVLSTGNIIKGNLVVGTIKDMQGKSGMDILMPSSFKVWSASNWVEDNVAAGSERYGYTYAGVPCSEPFLTGSFLNNTAHSCLAGVWLQASSDSQAEGCTALRNFTAYMNWDFGIITTRGLPTDLLMENVNVLDTKHSGVTVFRLSGFTEKGGFRWRGGLISGQSSDDVCKACARLADPGCHKKLSAQSFNREVPFTPAVGMQSAMFALGWAVGPEKKPYDKVMGYAVIHGFFNISGVTIADFLGPGGCGGADVGTYALANHPASAPEAFFPHFFSQMNVMNVATGPAQGMFLHTPPDPDWRNEADCGEAVYTRDDGTEIPLNCAGPAHVYWRDLDGSLTAGGDPSGIGTIAGIFTQPRVFPMDQGSPVLPGACTYSSVYDSYRCAVNSNTFLLDERLKPKPLPPAGIWGDPQHFVLESRDKDTEDRNFGPVFFNVSGSIDLVTTAMDHGWCFAYTCQKRLSTFWTYLPTFQTVYVNFTGTPSQNFRLWLPYADPNAELVLVINMLYTLNRRFVWLAPGNGPVSGRVTPQSKPVTVGDGTGHGAFYWDQDNTLLYVKIMGGKSLEIRTENAVMVAQSFALTVDQFYGTQQILLSNLASAMGINMERIYVASIVPGTATAKFGIGPSWDSIGPIPENDPQPANDPTSGEPSPPPPPPSTPPAGNSDAVASMLGLVKAFVAAVTDPNAAAKLGVQPIGAPVVDLGTLSDPLLTQALQAALTQNGIQATGGTASPPPPVAPVASSPPPPPPPSTPTTSGGSGTSNPTVNSPPPPPDATPGSVSKVNPTPSDPTPSGPTPSSSTPSGPTPSGSTPSDPTPSGSTPSGSTPSGSTPSDPTPSGPASSPTTSPAGGSAPTPAGTPSTPANGPAQTPNSNPEASPTPSTTGGTSASPSPNSAPAVDPSSPAASTPPVTANLGTPGSDPSVNNLPDRPASTPSPVAAANNDRAKKGISGKEIGAIVVAVAGAMVIGGVVAAAVVMRKRRRSAAASAAAPEPRSPSYHANAVVPSRSARVGSATSPREGFSTSNPTFESSRERSRRPSSDAENGEASGPGSRPGSTVGTPRAGSGTATPRASGVGTLAAGAAAPSLPEVLRPLVDASKVPRNKPLLDGGAGAAAASRGAPEVYHRSRVKIPAHLGRVDSSGPSVSKRSRVDSSGPSGRNLAGRANSITYAPSVHSNADDWEAEGAEIEPVALPAERRHKSMSERVRDGRQGGAFRPGSARSAGPDLAGLPPASRPRTRLAPLERPAQDPENDDGGSNAATSADGTSAAAVSDPGAAAAAAGADAAAAASSATPVTEVLDLPRPSPGAMVVPMRRDLETQESLRPKSVTNKATRPSAITTGGAAAGAAAAAAYTSGPDGPRGNDTGHETAAMNERGPAQPAAAAAGAPAATMMLPGGLMEFAATPSLLRSEVAALLLSAGDGAQGFAALEEALQEAQQQQQQGQQQRREQQQQLPQTRSPAGL